MVSFSCEGCGDVLTKKKLDPHRNQCRGASFTCLDCMVHFWGTEYRAHTSCISEAQKYQGALYRPDKEKKNNKQNQSKAAPPPYSAYIEDVQEDIVTVDHPVPEAPSPPPAAPAVNVFDFLVDSETPNPSVLELSAPEPMAMLEDGAGTNGQDMMRVRFEDEDRQMSEMVEYGHGPIPTDQYHTPAPKHERERERKKSKDRKDDKKDKKRKRLHVDTHSLSPRPDEVMTDAPPVLHSGLTGGLNRLLRPDVFPPSPDYSGADANIESPGSPLKKTKHSKKRGRGNTMTNILSMINPHGGSSREHSEDRPRKHRHRKHREESARPERKLIEYRPSGEEGDEAGDSQMVVYQPRAELLLSFISKGPDSERGVSMNKALKRYHRERTALGISSGRGDEEKELWRSLRMKKNERGEIVLFM
ncbi:LYAR-type C2HC zinc finger [Phlyctema vagabunda]|uniref:LYAR-type C2HC zinc finger n=1 Tax=Phlyctema vagabunda TaxID=108571 RepID=A0ABR4P3T9_9HELO